MIWKKKCQNMGIPLDVHNILHTQFASHQIIVAQDIDTRTQTFRGILNVQVDKHSNMHQCTKSCR